MSDSCRCVSVAGDITSIVCPIHGVGREETVPCATCGTATTKGGTERCDWCWEVESRLRGYLDRGGNNARLFVVEVLEASKS